MPAKFMKRIAIKRHAKKNLQYEDFLFANIDESIVVVDAHGKIIRLSQKARDIFGILPEDTVHDLFGKVFSLDEEKLADLSRQIIERVLSGQGWEGEHSLTIEGQEKTFMHRFNPLMDKGVLTGGIFISTDISELVAEREKAQTASMAKNQFLANMSHELRTPMIGIMGAVDLLEHSRLTGEQSAHIEIISECGKQLLGVINEILDVAKIEVGLVSLNPEPCNLFEVFTRTAKVVEPILMEKGLKLRLNLDSQMPAHIVVDHIKLGQVLLNILYNAAKFTSQGRITVKGTIDKEEQAQPHLLVSVSDTGIGSPREQAGNIFEAFTQVDGSNSREYTGAGLGLFICKKLLEVLQGEIWFDSTAGRGTTFHFKLPVDIVPASEKTADDVNQLSEPVLDDTLLLAFNPVRVLLAEDNPLNRNIVGQMLGNYGFEVITVPNGLECLKVLNEDHVDIILMDMQMPVMDGYETSRFIRENENLKHLPIIAVTANSMAGDSQKCLACGCSAYIAKPFNTEDLVQMIRKHLPAGASQSQANPWNQLIAELMPQFIELLSEMLGDLDVAVKTKNYAMVQSIGHDIKGTAGMYGFKEISRTAAQIEKAAGEGSYPELVSLSSDLYTLFQQTDRRVS